MKKWTKIKNFIEKQKYLLILLLCILLVLIYYPEYQKYQERQKALSELTKLLEKASENIKITENFQNACDRWINNTNPDCYVFPIGSGIITRYPPEQLTDEVCKAAEGVISTVPEGTTKCSELNEDIQNSIKHSCCYDKINFEIKSCKNDEDCICVDLQDIEPAYYRCINSDYLPKIKDYLSCPEKYVCKCINNRCISRVMKIKIT